jgi:hypothetical protein
MATIANLTVELAANVARLQTDMSKATNIVEGFARSAKTALGAVAAGITLTGMYSLIKSTTEAAENMELLQQKTGASYETLKVLSYTAKLSGTDIDGVSRALGILAKNMQGAAIDMDGSGKSFKALGLETKNTQGGLKSIDEMLPQIANKFQGMSNGTGKTAYAMALFGKSGKDMIPILNEGAGGLKEMKEEMEKLGFTFNESGNKQAAALNENLERLELAAGNMKSRIVKEVVPGLYNLSENLIKNIKDGGELESTITSLGNVMKGIAAIAIGVAASFDIVGTAIGNAAGRMKGWFSKEKDLALSKDPIKELASIFNDPSGKNVVASKAEAYGEMIDAIWNKETSKINLKKKMYGEDTPLLGTKGGAKDTAKDTVSAINALANAISRWREKVADLNPYLDTQSKKLVDLQIESEKLIMSGANLETVYDGISEGRAFLEMAKDAKYAAQAIDDMNKSAEEQLRLQQETRRVITDIAVSEAKSRTDMQTSLINLEVEKGTMTIKEGMETQYQLEKKLLDVEERRLRLFDDQGEGVTGEVSLEILKATTDLQAKRNTLDEQYGLELGKNRKAIILQSSSVSGGLKVAYEDLYKSRLTWSQAAYNFEMDTYRGMADGFENIFYDALTGDLKSMSDYWDSMWKSMARSMSQQLGQMASQWLMFGNAQQQGMAGMGGGGGMNYSGGSGGGWGGLLGSGLGYITDNAGSWWDSIGSWFGGGGSSGGSSDAGYPWDGAGDSFDWLEFHKGGVVGSTSAPMRHAGISGYVPRLHDGLAADEYPAILQAGETVIPKGTGSTSTDILTAAKQFRGVVVDAGYSYADMMGNATNDYVGSMATASSTFTGAVYSASNNFSSAGEKVGGYIGSTALGMVGSMFGGSLGGMAGKAIGGLLGGLLGGKIGSWFGNETEASKWDYGEQQADAYGRSQGPYGGSPNEAAGGGGGYGKGNSGYDGYSESGGPYDSGYGGEGYHYGGVPMYDRARNMLPGERLAKITNTEGVFTAGQMKAMGTKMNQGGGIGEIRIYLGNEELTGKMKVVADGVVVERNKRGVIPTSRVYNA